MGSSNQQPAQIQTPAPEEDFQEQQDESGFVKPKANEKRDKKAKRAEEKKRAREREAKKAAAANEYIPGMEGSVRPTDDDDNDNDAQQRPYVSKFSDVKPQFKGHFPMEYLFG